MSSEGREQLPSGASRSRLGRTLVPGHTLRYEGAAHAVNEDGQVVRVWEGRYGRALCSCGELSGLLHSGNQRRLWHAAHKAEVASRSGDSAPAREET